MEIILYGYMGIAEDLDKMDFNSKKLCITKSMKQIDQLEEVKMGLGKLAFDAAIKEVTMVVW